MVKYILGLLLALTITATANAEPKRTILFFTADWCGFCPVAKDMLLSSDMRPIVEQYDDNLIIDIDKLPGWKKYYGVTSIPVVMVVDLEIKNGKYVGTNKHHFRWMLSRNRMASKQELKNGLTKYAPKAPVKRRPLLNLLKNPVEFLKQGP